MEFAGLVSRSNQRGCRVRGEDPYMNLEIGNDMLYYRLIIPFGNYETG